MTLRDALGVDARHVYERVDEVLNSEDGIILLVDRRHATSYLQGFALSGCQIELLSVELERRPMIGPPSLAMAPMPKGTDAAGPAVSLGGAVLLPHL